MLSIHAANRLTSVGGVTYTWDDRGNLTHDGTFTYTYNAAGRMVQAESVTVTLVYTYNAGGLRVAQSVDGDVTAFAWDWVSGLPEMLADGSRTYLVGHETLGWDEGAAWRYVLPDALGSVRQAADGTGAVAAAREWTPYGVEVGGAQAGLGYAGEWWDEGLEMQYLRARWYDAQTGRFVSKDPLPTANRWLYADASPVNRVDPTGLFSNEAIARSLGAADFDEVIQKIRDEWQYHKLYGGGRWGLLRLLQDAKSGDHLRLLRVGFFGNYSVTPVGEFRCENGTIKLAVDPAYPNKPFGPEMSLTYFTEEGLRAEELEFLDGWRRSVQAYYLGSRGYRDGYLTDLPDFALVSGGLDFWAPDLLAGAGVGVQVADIVDRYGRGYLSVAVGASVGALPFEVNYSEGWVHRWRGGNHIASPGELDDVIRSWPIPSLEVDLGIVAYTGGVEFNLSQYVATTIGVGLEVVQGSGALSWTWRIPHSLNSKGWYWMELIPKYGEGDILQQGKPDPSGCGC